MTTRHPAPVEIGDVDRIAWPAVLAASAVLG